MTIQWWRQGQRLDNGAIKFVKSSCVSSCLANSSHLITAKLFYYIKTYICKRGRVDGSGSVEPQAQLSPWPNWAPAQLSPSPIEPQPNWAPPQLSPSPIEPRPNWAPGPIEPRPQLSPTPIEPQWEILFLVNFKSENRIVVITLKTLMTLKTYKSSKSP